MFQRSTSTAGANSSVVCGSDTRKYLGDDALVGLLFCLDGFLSEILRGRPRIFVAFNFYSTQLWF